MLKVRTSSGVGPPKFGQGLPDDAQFTFSSPPRAVMVTRKMYRNPPLQ